MCSRGSVGLVPGTSQAWLCPPPHAAHFWPRPSPGSRPLPSCCAGPRHPGGGGLLDCGGSSPLPSLSPGQVLLLAAALGFTCPPGGSKLLTQTPPHPQSWASHGAGPWECSPAPLQRGRGSAEPTAGAKARRGLLNLLLSTPAWGPVVNHLCARPRATLPGQGAHRPSGEAGCSLRPVPQAGGWGCPGPSSPCTSASLAQARDAQVPSMSRCSGRGFGPGGPLGPLRQVRAGGRPKGGSRCGGLCSVGRCLGGGTFLEGCP